MARAGRRLSCAPARQKIRLTKSFAAVCRLPSEDRAARLCCCFGGQALARCVIIYEVWSQGSPTAGAEQNLLNFKVYRELSESSSRKLATSGNNLQCHIAPSGSFWVLCGKCGPWRQLSRIHFRDSLVLLLLNNHSKIFFFKGCIEHTTGSYSAYCILHHVVSLSLPSRQATAGSERCKQASAERPPQFGGLNSPPATSKPQSPTCTKLLPTPAFRGDSLQRYSKNRPALPWMDPMEISLCEKCVNVLERVCKLRDSEVYDDELYAIPELQPASCNLCAFVRDISTEEGVDLEQELENYGKSPVPPRIELHGYPSRERPSSLPFGELTPVRTPGIRVNYKRKGQGLAEDVFSRSIRFFSDSGE